MRFHARYFGASCFHRNSIVWRRVLSARFIFFTGKVEVDDCAVLVFIENAHLAWIQSHIFSSHDSALQMGVGRKKTDFIIKKIITQSGFSQVPIGGGLLVQQKSGDSNHWNGHF